MAQEERQIFRQQSLEKLSSPDRLDEMLRIVNPPTWITLATIGVGLLLVLSWAIFGRIPAVVNGTAILIRPKQVVGFQSGATGPIAAIHVGVGDVVEVGRLLAQIHLPTLEKQLEQERARLAHYKSRSGEMARLEHQLAEKELVHIAGQHDKLGQRIEALRAAAERARQRDQAYIAKQRSNLVETRERILLLKDKLEQRRRATEELALARIVGTDQQIDAQRQQIENELRLAELEVKSSEIDLHEGQSLDSYEAQMDLLRQLEIESDGLRLQEMAIQRRLLESEILSETEIAGIENRIGELETQLASQGRILSEHAGRVIELTVSQGAHVSIGQRIGKLEIENPAAELRALAYFSVKDGKKLRPGLPIRVSPATVERERFGAIRGTVEAVSDYPVTTEAAANQIGDLELARRLLGGDSSIEVLARLALDPSSPTGYAWTSGKGPPDVSITAGTTARIRATIEERAPITLLLPFLESLSGS